MEVSSTKVSGVFTLFDDESTREKNKCMSKWDVVIDDARNDDIPTDDVVDTLLEFGKKYKITIEEVTE